LSLQCLSMEITQYEWVEHFKYRISFYLIYHCIVLYIKENNLLRFLYYHELIIHCTQIIFSVIYDIYLVQRMEE